VDAKPVRRAAQGGMPEGAFVQGRLIAVRIGRGKSKEWLYLFTTVELPGNKF